MEEVAAIIQSKPLAQARAADPDAKAAWKTFTKISRNEEPRGAIAAWTADQLMLGHRVSATRTLNRLARQRRLPGDGFPPKSQRKFVRTLLTFLGRRGY